MTDEPNQNGCEVTSDLPADPEETPIDLGTRTDAGNQRRRPPVPDEADFLAQLGSTIGHYEIIRPLGHGGMGRVLLARDTHLGRLVAVKVLTAPDTERFLAEAQVTAKLSHENIVVIHEIGRHRQWLYMVLEYLEGRTLRAWLDERQARESDAPGLSPRRAVEITVPIVQALRHAHEHGIAHRDLKPANIFLTDAGTVKVFDFGIAKLTDAPEPAPEDESADDPPEPAIISGEDLVRPHTRAGALVGSMPYMSPEQWNREAVDHRVDIWALGLLLWELCFAGHPLEPLTRAQLESVADLTTPMPSARELHPEAGKLASIIDRCLIKDREHRLPSATECLSELTSFWQPSGLFHDQGERNPFPGLAAFQEGDAARFHGRERAITRAVARLDEHPILTVVGPSGAGKSSFVRAGLIPALKRSAEAWESFTIRPGLHPSTALAELVLRSSVHSHSDSVAFATTQRGLTETGEDTRAALADRLRREPGLVGTILRARARSKLARIVLFVDQFEELYTLADDDERQHFFACLAGIADDVSSPLRVVLTMRSDFLDRVSERHSSMTGFGRGIMLLGPMDRQGLERAISRPLAMLDYRFENPSMIDEMLDALEQTSGALPLLQFTAAKLWDHRDRKRRLITLESYRRIGGVEGTVAAHADAILRGMSAAEVKIARTALLRLVTPERTRALVTWQELRELVSSDRLEPILERLIDARLLVAERSDRQEGTIEIVHESLIERWPTLSHWLDDSQEDRAFLDRLHRAAVEWHGDGETDGLLWRGEAARTARTWHQRYQDELATIEERFLQAVFDHAERQARNRRRLVIAAFAALLVVAIGMTYLAVRAERAAERARLQSLATERAAQRERMQSLATERAAVQARNATRMATARERQDDPTTMIAILREVEGKQPPRAWSALTKWALHSDVARLVLPHGEHVYAANFSSDGTRIVTASSDDLARVWSPFGPDGLRARPLMLRGHTDNVYFAEFSPDDRYIATAALDSTARLWNAETGEQVRVFRGHERPLVAVEFSPDGTRIATASADNTARIWNVDGSGQPIVLAGHARRVFAASFSPDGRRIATSSDDRTARIWNAETGEQLTTLSGHTARVRRVQFSPDGTRLVTASMDETARVWNADGSGEPVVLRGHANTLGAARFSPDGTQVVTASADKTAAVWNSDGSGRPRMLRGHGDRVAFAAFSPNGRCVVTSSNDNTVRVWDLAAKEEPMVLRGHTQRASSASFSPDGRFIASSSADKTARIWRSDGTGQPIVLTGHGDWVYRVTFSPDGQWIGTASLDGTARIWRADGTGEPRVFDQHTGRVYASSFSPDGSRFLTSSSDHTALLHHLDDSRAPVGFTGHTGVVYSAVFSPDGQRVVTSSADRTARVWSVEGGAPLAVLSGHSERLNWASFSPDGQRVVTGSCDRTARVWNADGSGQPIVLAGHTDWIALADFDPTGERVATASLDKTIRIWRADGSGQPVVLQGHTNRVFSARFSPDGRQLVSAAGDSTVRVWRELDSLAVDDERLWSATTYCLPESLRRSLFGTSESEAANDRAQCQERVAEVALRCGTPADR